MSAVDLFWAGLHFLPALVWAIVAENTIRLLRNRRPRSPLFPLLAVLAVLMSLNYGFGTVFELVHGDMHPALPAILLALYRITDGGNIGAVTVFRHMARFFPVRENPPGRAWLAANYGSGALMVALTCTFDRVIPAPTFAQRLLVYRVILMGYLIVMLMLAGRSVSRVAFRGGWRPGGLGHPNRQDVVVLGIGVTALFGVLGVAAAGGWDAHPLAMNVLLALIGLVFAVPIATRTLGDVVRGVVVTGAMLAVVAVVYFGVPHIAASIPVPAVARAVELAAVVALVVAVVPGQAWLRGQIERLVFRRVRQRRAALQAFLHTLSPDLGARECIRRALSETARVWQLRGVAMISPGGEATVHGDIPLEPILRAWPQAAAAGLLPTRSMVAFELRDLPLGLKEAMFDSDVVKIVPVASVRRRWGHLFIRTGLLGATYNEEDLQAVEGFAAQLALVLDGTELLERAVAVERTLAHAEKLAAIGELAARIAHEIRNPVTAARSLAQQLCREPASPFAAEHGLILGELERVERQVAALLRFARREDFRFAPVELAGLVRATVDAFRTRLETGGVALDLELADGLVVRADAEKVRQVLVNLIENALEALAETPGRRALAISVGGVDGTATVRVSDTGPGVPAEALPHLFEPFFSLKPSGTGLGLAIARRTVEAHGGRIAASMPATGMAFEVVLPLGGTSGGCR